MTISSRRTRYLYALPLFTLLFLCTTARAQDAGSGVTATGSNSLRVGAGNTDEGDNQVVKRYLEEIANAHLFFDNFSLAVRYELDDPSEVGPSFQGIRRRWINYKKDKLELQAGDVNALYGRGAAINLFESRPLNYDTWLDGVSGSYEYNWTKAQSEFTPSIAVRGVAGKLNFINVDTTQPPMAVSARAVNAEVGFFKKQLTLGGSFVQAFTSVMQAAPRNALWETDRQVNQPEAYIGMHAGKFDFFGEYTENHENLSRVRNLLDTAKNNGSAGYAALSYASSDLGITFEYKNYAYLNESPSAVDAQYFGKLPISSPPEVYKDFTYTSITRTTHSVDFNDELGYQLEANITAIQNVVIDLYGAASSRHKAYGGILDSNGVPNTTGSTSLLPKLNDLAYYPFWEGFAEMEFDLGGQDYIRLFWHRRGDVIVYNPTSPEQTDRRRSTTIGAKVQYETSATQSLLFILENQWLTDYSLQNLNSINELITFQYTFNAYFNCGGIFDFSTAYAETRHIWPEAYISVRIGDSHSMIVSYGSERGGLNCTGGICRVVPPFNGMRFTLTTQI